MLLIAAVLMLVLPGAVMAEDIYRITLLRATPGKLPTLIEQAKAYRVSHDGKAIIMRHSQGDHWDLMLLEPAGDKPLDGGDFRMLSDFQHRFLATSDWPWDKIADRANSSGLFHIEMFHAVAGRLDGLLEQRRMENSYLESTKRLPNAVFTTQFGSDVDCFTVGFYDDLAQFAANPELPPEAFEVAAREAGFQSRGDIGFYLRQFLLAHHDTLATRVE